MSHKAICPRGHIWDPSTIAGLPPTATPRCPICGETEPVRTRNVLRRLRRWCRENPLLAGLSLACFLLAVALAVTLISAVASVRRARETAEREINDAPRLVESNRSPRQGETASEEMRRQARQMEMERTSWREKLDESKAERTRAERERKQAVQQRDEQAQARKIAEELTRTADQVRQDAVSRREEAARQLVKMHVAAGTRWMESGDLSASLLSFAEALRLAQREHLPEEKHRLRIAAVLAQCPRPVRIWTNDKKVNAVQLSPDGKRVVTTGADGAAVIWDAATGKRVGEPLAHMAAVSHASFSADGKNVLTATTDMTVHVWDLGMGKEAFPEIQLMGPVVALSFSPDGRRFLTVAYKSAMEPTEVELRVWDAATGEATGEQPLGSEISPRLATFSPDGKKILTICRDRSARIWDITTEKQVGSAFGHTAEVVHASFSADGKRVLTASADGTARVWQASNAEPVTRPLKHGSAVRSARFSPEGRFVITVGEDHGVRVWDTETSEPVGRTLRHDETVSGAVFSPDGRYVLTTCDDGAARLFDFSTGEEVVPAMKHGSPIRYAAFNPAGNGLHTLSGQVLRLWDVTAGEPPASPPTRPETGLTVFSPDGRRTLRITDTTVRVYDTEKNRPIGEPLRHDNKVSSAAFSRDGRRVLTVSHQPNGDEREGQVRVWETETGKPIGEALIHPRAIFQVSFGADGQHVLTACQDGKVRLWDVAKGALVGEAMEHKQDVSRALFTPDGRRILTVDIEGGMRLWDAMKAEVVGPTWGHRKAIHHLSFSADGGRLVTASDDGTARVWKTDTGDEVAEMAGHDGAVVYAAFSPDGKRVVTVGGDRRARVWDAANGKPVIPPLRHRAAVSLGAFSADGRWLVTVAADGLRVWDARSGESISPLVKLDQESGPVHDIALGRDGRLVLRIGVPGDPSGQLVREFRADARPAADLLLVAEVLDGQRMTDAGETAPFEGAEMEKAWQQVQKKYGKEFVPTAGHLAAWDQRGEAECERRQLWSGAVRHLDRLLAAGASAELYARRAQANAALRQWEPARSDYTKALESNTENWELWAGRAKVEDALGRWEQAAADYSKAIEKQGDRAELWAGRGRAEAERGDWPKAAADLGKAIHLGDKEVTVVCQHALALLAGSDEANYRRACGRLVQNFGSSNDETVARSIAWTCTLAEGAVRDLKPMLRRAEQAVKANPRSADDLRRLALLLYRGGQFDAALTRLQEVTRLVEPEAEARDALFMAMTAQRQGHGEEAKKWLDKADQLTGAKAKGQTSPWEERIAYQILHREAVRLVKGAKP
jgi:WD40 repeat protein/tetratricopeptide (TPR) repeat protein